MQTQVVACQGEIRQQLSHWEGKVDPTDQPPAASKIIKVEGLSAPEAEDLRQTGHRLLGVDLT